MSTTSGNWLMAFARKLRLKILDSLAVYSKYTLGGKR